MLEFSFGSATADGFRAVQRPGQVVKPEISAANAASLTEIPPGCRRNPDHSSTNFFSRPSAASHRLEIRSRYRRD
jgi:hypothetical protein